MAKPRTPAATVAYAPAPPLRWARASRERGHFCRDDSHHGTEYVFLETRSWGTADDGGLPLEKLACGTCWPQDTNPTALRDRVVRPGGPVAWPAPEIEGAA